MTSMTIFDSQKELSLEEEREHVHCHRVIPFENNKSNENEPDILLLVNNSEKFTVLLLCNLVLHSH
ncbi:hypothetical protein KJ652_07425 [Patescibacteria group bacterium]|nr:hypothetical protein [Patescibacteria group bacterium]MBU1124376.1 hypothetical protein [Patescibacteria group bacterium]MBU1910943.1 hypothetical protein [Patescibacteria group bacterium]